MNLYRRLFQIGSVLIILIGIVSAVSDATMPEGGSNFLTIIAGFIPFLILSTILLFFAETIKLALTIESHLYKIANQ